MNENNSNKAIDWNNLSFQAITTKSIFLAINTEGAFSKPKSKSIR